MNDKKTTYAAESFRIMERAVGNLADSTHRREVQVDEDIKDILLELKALKLFMARNMPEIKKHAS